ncbi:MAG: VWA domain-containing protein [Planctomycetota bacterium]|nr:MAG: VWA domain-containing protein [Planctomycetota bacterium]
MWTPEASSATLIAGNPTSDVFGLQSHAWNGIYLGTTCALSADWFFGAYGTPPYNRGYLPPRQDSDRIYRFNNPNRTTFSNASSKLVYRYLNKVGYLTYVQFMLDHGRDLKPDGKNYVPLSQYSPHCPWHSESTAGGTFSFPPREQPMHAARRALIAAIQVIKERNATIRNPNQRDWVSIVTFDVLSGGGPVVVQPLTGDYRSAMERCTTLQACGDKGASTATEAGLIAAREHLKPKSEGGFGREATNKIVVLLTDGVPNLYVSPPSKIDQFIGNNPSPDFYNNGAYWYDAALMQAMEIQLDNWQLFPVGVGLGTDYDFMDRMARMGATANDDGQSPRGSGNPAEYEQRLTEIFRQIIESPRVRLVQ